MLVCIRIVWSWIRRSALWPTQLAMGCCMGQHRAYGHAHGPPPFLSTMQTALLRTISCQNFTLRSISSPDDPYGLSTLMGTLQPPRVCDGPEKLGRLLTPEEYAPNLNL